VCDPRLQHFFNVALRPKSLPTPGLVTSHSTMLTVVRFSPTQFYIWQKTGRGIRYFLGAL